jgi:Holliday junction resolvase RusA-like endonuclease
VSLFEGPDVIHLHVRGVPQTQGSVRAILPKGKKQPIVVQGSSAAARKSLEAWRSDVAKEARKWCDQHWEFQPLTGPVQLRLIFGLRRPQSAPKTRRTWPIGKNSGDLDKLARAVFDALTGVLLKDDSLVIGMSVSKDYDDVTGVRIAIRPVVR